MRKFTALYLREMRAYFCSPVAYAVWFFFLLLAGLSFWFTTFLLNNERVDLTVIEMFFKFVFLFGLILSFPLLTMRLFAEEFRLGTVEPLMTAPVSDWQVVLSKYAAALSLYALLWAPTAVYFPIYRTLSEAPVAGTSEHYWACYLLVLLMGAFYLAIGLLTSALTRNQIIAAVASFSLIAILFYGGGFLSGATLVVSPDLRDAVAYVSAMEHMNDFFRGVIDSRPIIFYVSMSALTLAAAHTVVQHRRWRA